MKFRTAIICVAITAVAILGVFTLESRAEETSADLISTGRFTSGDGDVVFDYRDLELIEKSIDEAKTSAYSLGYAEGFAAQPAISANVTYTYHHHDAGKGEPTEVSFTGEEVENGTKDAWFVAHPVPEKVTSPIGVYTRAVTRREPYIDHYIHHDAEPTGPGEWVREERPQYDCGYTMEWTGAWTAAWDEPVYAYRDVVDGYVPSSNCSEGECIKVEVILK